MNKEQEKTRDELIDEALVKIWANMHNVKVQKDVLNELCAEVFDKGWMDGYHNS